MHKFIIILPHIILILLASSIVQAVEQNSLIGWTKINDKDNIAVYSMTVKDSSILKIKTSTTLPHSSSLIQSILNKVEHRANWIPYLQACRVIERLSDIENIEYSLFSAPWPATDREFVYNIKQISNSASSIVFQMSSVLHPDMPESDRIIRANLIESTYVLTTLSPDKTQVELIFRADPRGWLPDWIINIINRVLPYLILKNLKSQADIFEAAS